MPLKVLVISRSSRIPSTERLVDAARKRGHSARVLAAGDIDMHIEARHRHLLVGGKRLRPFDVVIPRIAGSIASYGLPLLDHFASYGAAVMNSGRAIGQSRNPARCLQLLSAHGIDIPITVMSRDVEALKSMVPLLGGPPVLLKLLQGSERRGMMVCESRQSLEAAMEAVLGLGHNVVLQEYVRGAERDVRVFIVGGRALASVERTARPFRLSKSLGRHGRMLNCTISDAACKAAETAAVVCELEVCAVDLIEVKGAIKVFDVNASPELPRMEAATGVDLADAIVAHAEVLVARREATSGGTSRPRGDTVEE